MFRPTATHVPGHSPVGSDLLFHPRAPRLAGVDGPYGPLPSDELYTSVAEPTGYGYPVRDHLARLPHDGGTTWALALSSAELHVVAVQLASGSHGVKPDSTSSAVRFRAQVRRRVALCSAHLYASPG